MTNKPTRTTTEETYFFRITSEVEQGKQNMRNSMIYLNSTKSNQHQRELRSWHLAEVSFHSADDLAWRWNYFTGHHYCHGALNALYSIVQYHTVAGRNRGNHKQVGGQANVFGYLEVFIQTSAHIYLNIRTDISI